MSFREMFLAEHPIDGEQMLEEARIKAAKGSALFDALETHMKQALLAKLRDEVEGLEMPLLDYIDGYDMSERDGYAKAKSEVLALLEKAGE